MYKIKWKKESWISWIQLLDLDYLDWFALVWITWIVSNLKVNYLYCFSSHIVLWDQIVIGIRSRSRLVVFFTLSSYCCLQSISKVIHVNQYLRSPSFWLWFCFSNGILTNVLHYIFTGAVCDGKFMLTDSSGFFNSMNYPKPYNANIICQWIIL